MEIKVSWEELRKSSIFVATPMYGGNCSGIYANSLVNLGVLCVQSGISFMTHYLYNESLITRARAYCCDEFLRSGATHLMFIDSDIGFNPQDVINMLALVRPDSPYDVIAGPYPKKTIAWEKVKMAVDKGIADNNSNILEKFVGDYVINPKQGQNNIKLTEPVEVREAGTGFMMIRRETLLKYREAYPHLSYRPDHARTEHFDGSREIHMFFDCMIDPETKRYLSEDYKFCYDVQKMGGKVWLCPWIELQHAGTYIFGGSLKDLAAIGAPATVDQSMLKKNQQPVHIMK